MKCVGPVSAGGAWWRRTIVGEEGKGGEQGQVVALCCPGRSVTSERVVIQRRLVAGLTLHLKQLARLQLTITGESAAPNRKWGIVVIMSGHTSKGRVVGVLAAVPGAWHLAIHAIIAGHTSMGGCEIVLHTLPRARGFAKQGRCMCSMQPTQQHVALRVRRELVVQSP